MHVPPAQSTDYSAIRQLFDDYLRMYASRDDRLTTYFSDDFSGFTGGGDFLVKDKPQWVAITRQDFTQVKDPIRIELKDVAIQSLADTVAVATGFFILHLPIKDHILSRETARLVLIFHKEAAGWKISHSSISIPYHLVRAGEVYPLKELVDRNQLLEKLAAERTTQLTAANTTLLQANAELAQEMAERKQTADALQRSEERYRSILLASPDDITIVDQEGRIVMVSPVALSMFGCKEEKDFLGLQVTDFLVPEDRERALAQIALKRQGVTTNATEYRGLRPDGGTLYIEVNSEFIRDAAGTPTGMVVIVRDITERKQTEAEQARLEAQNQQLQKAESLGRMAGAIAHHFNNQLQAVMMSLDLAMSDLPKNAAAVENMKSALQSAQKAAEVSGLMLTYLGLTTAHRETRDLSAMSSQGLPLLRALMPQSIVFQTEMPAPGPVIRADPNQIQHILTNLVTNAWESCPDARGTVRLSVKTVPAAEIAATHRFPIDSEPQDTTYACIEVADSGCGIADTEIEKIFDPFYSRKFTGRGMGLAVVLGLTRTHDGIVTVESEQGRGSVFRVFLPVVAAGIAPM